MLIYVSLRVMPKVVNAALKTKAWTFEAKAIKFGLETYITGQLVLKLFLFCQVKSDVDESWSE